MKRLYIFTIVIILFSSIRAQNQVVINVLDKSNSRLGLSIRKQSKIRFVSFFTSENVGNVERITDSTYIVRINDVFEPQLLEGPSTTTKRQLLLVTPGDSLNAILTPPADKWDLFEVRFYGKNAENYNKYADLNKIFNRNELFRQFNKSLKEYIQKLDSAYTVNTGIIEEQVASPLLKNIMLNEEIAQFFWLLRYPNSLADRKLTHEEILYLKDKFFQGKIVENSPLLMGNSNYTSGMQCLSDFLTDSIKSERPLMAVTDTINKYFDGELRDYLLANKYYTYCMRCGITKMEHPDIDKWFDLYFDKIAKTDKEYHDFILFARENYKKYIEPFPEEVLKVRLASLSDSISVTFQELLDKYKGKQIVLDNWASWCGPCAREIKEGKKNVQELEKRGNVFVYLSLDKSKDFNKARAKAGELGIIENAYIVSGDFNSAYAKYINVKDIPRFVLIDKDGRLKRLRVSNPSLGNFQVYD